MKKLAVIFLLSGLLSVTAQQAGSHFQQEIYQARDKVLPALVHIQPIISVYTSGEKQHTTVTGSGVIFSPKGYVLTNHHVVENAEKVWCTLSNKERITARVVGSDPETDIAVIQLNLEELKADSLPYARLGNSDSLQVGQLVLALGSPLGLSRSVSMGVVSSIDRYFPGSGSKISPYNLWIQTDAAINPGNSGGPLINLNGEVIGINARGVFLAENLGFAIPINLAREIATKIIQKKNVKRAWVGLEFQEIHDFKEYLGKPDFRGVLVAEVFPRSPAQAAGIQPGDVLLKLNNHPLHAEYEENLPAIRKLFADLPIGTPATLTVWRNGKILRKKITPIEEPFHTSTEFEATAWGMVVNNLNWDVYQAERLPDFNGVYVVGVKTGEPADRADISTNDVIRSVDGRPIHNLDDFKQVYQTVKNKPLVLLEVMNRGIIYYKVIKLSETPN